MPGQYTVVETQNPPNTNNGTPTSNGVPVPPGTPPDTIPVTLPPGGDSLQNNFPKVTAAKVSGFVYQDVNNNGVFDAGDAPIPNASVTISGTPAGGFGPISQDRVNDGERVVFLQRAAGRLQHHPAERHRLRRAASTPSAISAARRPPAR